MKLLILTTIALVLISLSTASMGNNIKVVETKLTDMDGNYVACLVRVAHRTADGDWEQIGAFIDPHLPYGECGGSYYSTKIITIE